MRHSKPKSNRQSSGREAQIAPSFDHDYWLYGKHAVLAALQNPERKLRRLVLTEETRNEIDLPAAALKPEILDRRAMDELLPGAVHQGIAAKVQALPRAAIEDILEKTADKPNALVLVLDQVTDPHNVGAIIRSAAAFNADAVILQDRHSPPLSAAMAKAASGGLEVVPLLHVVNINRAIEQLKEANFWAVGMDGEAPQTLAEAQLSGKLVLILGAEGEGMRRLTREACDLIVKLPISSQMESLNVSNAAAIALYELRRNS
ncbi:MAG: 23S rRNA (guanosine(2251)-2'-O)-methyltransferase RlmB [Dongiaceae bacterium]